MYDVSTSPTAQSGLGQIENRGAKIGAREEVSGGLSGTAMGRLDRRQKAAVDDVQLATSSG